MINSSIKDYEVSQCIRHEASTFLNIFDSWVLTIIGDWNLDFFGHISWLSFFVNNWLHLFTEHPNPEENDHNLDSECHCWSIIWLILRRIFFCRFISFHFFRYINDLLLFFLNRLFFLLLRRSRNSFFSKRLSGFFISFHNIFAIFFICNFQIFLHLERSFMRNRNIFQDISHGINGVIARDMCLLISFPAINSHIRVWLWVDFLLA